MAERLAGTWPLVRLALRRDRVLLPAWILGFAGMAGFSASATVGLYPDESQRVTAAEAAEGLGIVQLFVKAGLAASGKDAKRLIAEGGARLNDELVTDQGLRLGASHLAEPLKLTAGKKRHALVVLD